MSVSAAELPAMSSAHGDEQEVAAALRQRLDAGLRRMAFFVIPSAVAFLALGDVIVAAIFQSGRFTYDDAVYVWGILAGAAIGLLASTLGRLYASAYYALRDTRTPLYFAVVRIAIGTGLGYLGAMPLPPTLGLEARWGVAGLTVASSLAGWVELVLLRRTLNRRIGHTGLGSSFVAKLWAAAVTGSVAAWLVKLAVASQHPILAAVSMLIPYGVVYFGLTSWWKVAESPAIIGQLARVVRQATD
jgi:putative peptidoglycan lipid II flippase